MKFRYWARTKEGKVQTGIVEAFTKEAAINTLKGHGLYVTGMESTEAVPIWARQIRLFERVSAMDLVAFSRQLAVMFQSGVPLAEGLEALAAQIQKHKFRETILKLAQEVRGGTTFSKSLTSHPNLFSEFYIAVVRAGEVSGTLGQSLDYLADHLEKENRLYSRVKGAMIYPVIVVLAVVGTFVLMTVFIIPQLVSVLEASGAEPPTLTKMAIALSDFMKTKWWVLLILIIGLIGGGWWYVKTPKGREMLDRIILKIPAIGNFLKKIYLTRFSENLSTLIRGGLPIGQALEVSGSIIGNKVYQQIILESKDRVSKGESITLVFSGYPNIFTPLFCQMSLVGEKTGHLEKTLMNVANFYEEEINRTTENLVNIIEPVLILVLGGMVGLLMAAVVVPLYQISAGAL